jgi:hypothetical protein
MRLFRRPLAWWACLTFLAGAAAVRADTPPDPLRLVPDKADFFFKFENPRKLAESYAGMDVLKQLYKLDAVREAYDSTNARRFFQLVAYFEKQLGMKWPEALDRLAGGGAVVAVKIADNPAPALLVVQGKEEKLLKKFFRLALTVAEQELARQESKDRPVKGTHRQVETVQIGKQFHAAVAGSALLVSNNAKALHMGIDLHLDGDKTSLAKLETVGQARKLVGPAALAWGWLNMETVRQFPQAKDFFAEKQNDPILTFSFGHYLDLARRSPFLCAGLSYKDSRWALSLRFPRGREGMPAKWAAFLPPAGKPSTPPLLKPKNVIYSSSGYVDFSQFWERRNELFNDKQVKTFETFDKTSGRFLAGTRLSTLMKAAGPDVRFVAAQQTKPGYKTKPRQLFPHGAYVIGMRKPDEFGKAMDTVLRGAALLGGGNLDLKLVEEKKGKYTLVGYRFPEPNKKKKPTGFLRNDVSGIRYNFSPCFVRTDKHFIVSSTMELAAELVDLLDKEAQDPQKKFVSATRMDRLYGRGGAALLGIFRDQLLTQTILGQAATPQDAEKQVKRLIDLVGRLGVLKVSERVFKNSFHYNFEWQMGK